MQRSIVHQFYTIFPRSCVRERTEKLRVLETSSTFRLPLLRLGSISWAGRAQRGGKEEVSPLEEIEKGWRERQEAGVINC